MRRFRRNPLAVGGAAVLLLLAASAVFAPVLAPRPPDAVDPRLILRPPSLQHPLGTDDTGRDALSRLLYAGRVSLALGLGVAVLAVSAGAALGALAGYWGGRVDAVISALINTLLSLPVVAVAMVLGSFLHLTPLRLIALISAFSWMNVARLVRGQVISLREWPYVEVARAAGASDWRVLFRHILPGALGPIAVSGTLLVAQAILYESALSFLGFGVRPPTATWGNMLNAAQVYVREAPWLAAFPGLAITISVTSVNFVGEGLRESLDPRLGRR